MVISISYQTLYLIYWYLLISFRNKTDLLEMQCFSQAGKLNEETQFRFVPEAQFR